jgi:hypothetical protein
MLRVYRFVNDETQDNPCPWCVIRCRSDEWSGVKVFDRVDGSNGDGGDAGDWWG